MNLLHQCQSMAVLCSSLTYDYQILLKLERCSVSHDNPQRRPPSRTQSSVDSSPGFFSRIQWSCSARAWIYYLGQWFPSVTVLIAAHEVLSNEYEATRIRLSHLAFMGDSVSFSLSSDARRPVITTKLETTYPLDELGGSSDSHIAWLERWPPSIVKSPFIVTIIYMECI